MHPSSAQDIEALQVVLQPLLGPNTDGEQVTEYTGSYRVGVAEIATSSLTVLRKLSGKKMLQTLPLRIFAVFVVLKTENDWLTDKFEKQIILVTKAIKQCCLETKVAVLRAFLQEPMDVTLKPLRDGYLQRCLRDIGLTSERGCVKRGLNQVIRYIEQGPDHGHSKEFEAIVDDEEEDDNDGLSTVDLAAYYDMGKRLNAGLLTRMSQRIA
ncbi:hypothetical protein LTR27_000134 [Elasticomyces elasticus]|nr:hypothetical protein LTR27_000134 [Elasticomyces elasticus]